MMFLRATKHAFYSHVGKARTAARKNNQTFNRRDERARVTYEVNGLPTAQAVLATGSLTAKYYVLR